VSYHKNLARYGANNTIETSQKSRGGDSFESKHCQKTAKMEKSTIIRIIFSSKIRKIKKM
jgi:hypothetical protein